jgi:outer membrane receptor for ferrienterochelin and colicins
MKKLIFIFFISQTLLAQEDTLRGIVQETSGKPLPGASVFWLGTSTGTAAGANGVFRLKTEPRRYKLVVSFVGYKPDTLTVVGEDNVQIALQPEAGTLQEVEVSAQRSSTYVDALSARHTKIMSEKELFKAACCNLSESFETNPSVDVAFSDAVTGTKQIQMLGLAGIYTQITTENMPGIRGLASNYGLSFIPGSWIESIQVTKGTGSVANGYESMAGQINVEMKKPQTAEKLFFNAYANQMGRLEANLNLNHALGKKWGTMLLLHGNLLDNQVDMNDDGFLDLPTGNQFNLFNRWSFTDKNWIVQFGFSVLEDRRQAGQLPGHNAVDHDTVNHIFTPQPLYQIQLRTQRQSFFAKTGYVFTGKPYKSAGLQISATNYNFRGDFGSEAVRQNRYAGSQQTFYANFLYQSIIGNTNHIFRTGASFLADGFEENFNAKPFRRTEIVPGFFGEYTYNFKEKLSVIAGLRGDFHNLLGFLLTPRLHFRYNPTENTTLRLSAGHGTRTANLFAENTAVFVSSRAVSLPNPNQNWLAERSWNYGMTVTQEFELLSRKASLNLDFFRTDFQQQAVVNMENPQQIRFESLQGKSFSNSFQAEFDWQPVRKLDLRLAYRWFDVNTTFNGQLLQRPFVSQNRAFANAGYAWRKWKLDFTVNWNGSKRLPSTMKNPESYRFPAFSPAFWLMNGQVSRTFGKKLEIYLGVENLTDLRQQNLINDFGNPYSPYFDASLVWGPVIGRMGYAGLRWKLN